MKSFVFNSRSSLFKEEENKKNFIFPDILNIFCIFANLFIFFFHLPYSNQIKMKSFIFNSRSSLFKEEENKNQMISIIIFLDIIKMKME